MREQESRLDFAKPYRVGKTRLGKERMEDVNEFNYLGTILCKHGSMERDIRERAVKGRRMMGALEGVMKGRNVSMVVKKGIRNSVILTTLICLRDMDMECNTAITSKSSGNELHAG